LAVQNWKPILSLVLQNRKPTLSLALSLACSFPSQKGFLMRR
jgi:hypothetical protein